MTTSRLSSKGQVTIPQQIRDAVGLKVGDLVAYEIHDEHIHVRRVEPFDPAYHLALSTTLDEWDTPEDEQAFHDL